MSWDILIQKLISTLNTHNIWYVFYRFSLLFDKLYILFVKTNKNLYL